MVAAGSDGELVVSGEGGIIERGEKGSSDEEEGEGEEEEDDDEEGWM